jgi:DNA-binding MurR/RpiR family transcriptional regulator
MEANPHWMLKLREVYPDLGSREQQVADFVCDHLDTFLNLSIHEISRMTGTSKSTVVRFCNHLGYGGLKEFKIHFYKSERIPPVSSALIEYTDTLDMVKAKIFSGCIKSLQDSYQLMNSAIIEDAAALMAKANHIDIYGLGGSVPIANYLRHQLMKTGIRSSVYANVDSQQLSLVQIGKKDAIVIISCTGVSRELVHVIEKAKKLKTGTIAITNFPNSPLGRIADIVIQNTGTCFCGNDNNTYSRLAQLATVDFLYIAVSLKTGRKQIFLRETL